jgi:GMP synthase-like glutamine amidotransferase
MKIHILQHTPDSKPGLALEWLASHKLEYSITRFFKGESLPASGDVDFLIICGGAMGAYEDSAYSWMAAEKKFLKQCLDEKKIIFAICLGSQLIASALGAEVKRHTDWEIGWHDIQFVSGETLRVFEYHQDTFTLPPGAELIASNPFCKNQAYRLGPNVIATQFHPEATDEWIRIHAEDPELPIAPHAQSKTAMLEGRSKYLPKQRDWFFKELDRLFHLASDEIKANS